MGASKLLYNLKNTETRINKCSIGDRVQLYYDKKTTGIVIDLDVNGFQNTPRAKIFWSSESRLNRLYLKKYSFICEGNLKILHTDESLKYINRNQ